MPSPDEPIPGNEPTPRVSIEQFVRDHNDRAKSLGAEMEKMRVVTMLREQAAACTDWRARAVLTAAADSVTQNRHRPTR